MIDGGFRVFNTDGDLQNTIPSDPKYGSDRKVYHRQDLHHALVTAATSTSYRGRPVTIHRSSKVISCDCEAGIVETFDGTQHHGDVIIAADGIHSNMRHEVLGNKLHQPIPTGMSAYRLLFETDTLRDIPNLKELIDVNASATTMIFGHDKRIVCGPGRGGKLYGMVGLVPDEQMNEDASGNSWTSQGSMDKMLESFNDFPDQLKEILKRSPEVALWQLRDIDPLETWVRGRTILIGDAAHAMLPIQGQGASQSVEDAEALQAVFEDVHAPLSRDEVHQRLIEACNIRHERASLIQRYSRQGARAATAKGEKRVTLNPGEFLEYCCTYDGARDWQQKHKISQN